MTNFAKPHAVSNKNQTTLQKVCKSILLSQFSKMSESRLSFTTETGETLDFGDANLMRPHAELTVLDPKFYERSVLYGAIGFAESYIDGEWVTNDLTKVIEWFIHNNAIQR